MPADGDPSVAIIVPVYNSAAFLDAALRSVLVQEGCRITSVIVVDDGSTDASADIAAAWPAPVRVIRQAHAGAASARNRGLAAAAEDLIGWLDADDLLPSGSVAARVAALRADPDLDAAFGMVTQFVSGDPNAADRFVVPDGPVSGYLQGAMLFRRRVFEQVGGFDPSLRLGDFIDWYSRAKAGGMTSCLVDAVVLERRIHGGNLTLRDKAASQDYLTVVRRHLARRR